MKKISNLSLKIIPDIASFVRDVTEYGNIGAIRKRLLKLSLSQLIKFFWINKKNIINILKKDFSTGALVLMETELFLLEKKPRFIFLSYQLTDQAIVLDNQKIIKKFSEIAGNIFKLNYGFYTNNLPFFVSKMGRWKIKPNFILTPINSYGYQMNPNKKTVEDYLSLLNKDKIIAAIPKLENKEINYLKKLGIKYFLETNV